jgi:hypothetical protein
MEEKGGCMEEIGVNQERPSEVLRKVQNCGIDCGYRAILRPAQSSIVERMRAAVVVARLTAHGGNI